MQYSHFLIQYLNEIIGMFIACNNKKVKVKFGLLMTCCSHRTTAAVSSTATSCRWWRLQQAAFWAALTFSTMLYYFLSVPLPRLGSPSHAVRVVPLLPEHSTDATVGIPMTVHATFEDMETQFIQQCFWTKCEMRHLSLRQSNSDYTCLHKHYFWVSLKLSDARLFWRYMHWYLIDIVLIGTRR